MNAIQKMPERVSQWRGLPLSLSTLMVLRWRRLGNHECCLEHALRLVDRHPGNGFGYAAAAFSLAALGRPDDALAMTRRGLEAQPAHWSLLIQASDGCRAAGDRVESLGYAQRMIELHPEREAGWIRSVEDLVALRRFREAEDLADRGSQRLPRCRPLLDRRSSPGKLIPFERIDLRGLLEGQFLSLEQPPDPGIAIGGMVPPNHDTLHLVHSEHARITADYGAYDVSGRPLEGCFFFQAGEFVHGSPRAIRPPDRGACRPIPFALHLTHIELRHFGHLLTDGCSAIYPLLLWSEQRDLITQIPIVVHPCLRNKVPDLCDLLGLRREQFLIPSVNTGDLLVRHLLTPAPTIVNGGIIRDGGYVSRCHPQIVGRLKDLMLSRQPPCDEHPGGHPRRKLYISRSRLSSSHRLFIEESELEHELVALGWTVFHPQEHDLSTQCRALEEADCICASQGSALHLLFAIRPRRNLRLILLSRSPVNLNYPNQFEVQSIDHRVMTCLERIADDPARPARLRHLRLIKDRSPADLAREIDLWCVTRRSTEATDVLDS